MREDGEDRSGDFDIKLVRAFVEVARDLSFTRAAARLGVPQPRLTTRIQTFEEQLGFMLLRRSSRKVELTEEGVRLLESAEHIIAVVDRARSVAADLRAGRSGRLSVGATAFKVPQRWAILRGFLSAFPDTALHVESGVTLDLLDKLRSGTIDLGFTLGPIPPDLKHLLLSNGRIGLAVPTAWRQARPRPVTLRDLAGSRVAMFPRMPDPALHDRVRAKLIAHGVRLVDLPELNGEAMTQFIRQTGTNIVSAQWWWDADGSADLDFVPVEEITETMGFYLVSVGEPSNPAAIALWRMVEEGVETFRPM